MPGTNVLIDSRSWRTWKSDYKWVQNTQRLSKGKITVVFKRQELYTTQRAELSFFPVRISIMVSMRGLILPGRILTSYYFLQHKRGYWLRVESGDPSHKWLILNSTSGLGDFSSVSYEANQSWIVNLIGSIYLAFVLVRTILLPYCPFKELFPVILLNQ